jgi:hypothetical protein
MDDWRSTLARLAEVEARMVAVLDGLGLTALVTSIPGLSAVGAAVILAETDGISTLTAHALHAALSLGGEVIAVSVHPDAEQGTAFRAARKRWNPGCGWTSSTVIQASTAVDSLRHSIARMVENLMPPRPRPFEWTNHPPSMSLSRLIGGRTTLLLPTGQQNPGVEGDRDPAGGGGLSA